jgi:YD repeat-containing protein
MSNGRPYRKVQCIDRINGTRFYVYDANNNIKTITLENNANGGAQTTTYLYDAYDRKTEEELPSPDGQVRKTTIPLPTPKAKSRKTSTTSTTASLKPNSRHPPVPWTKPAPSATTTSTNRCL